MCNLYTKFVKILEICKQFSHNLVNEQGNITRRGPISKFSDLKVVALSLTAESESIDSEKWLFDYKLQELEKPHQCCGKPSQPYKNKNNFDMSPLDYQLLKLKSQVKYSPQRKDSFSYNVCKNSVNCKGMKKKVNCINNVYELTPISHSTLICHSHA